MTGVVVIFLWGQKDNRLTGRRRMQLHCWKNYVSWTWYELGDCFGVHGKQHSQYRVNTSSRNPAVADLRLRTRVILQLRTCGCGLLHICNCGIAVADYESQNSSCGLAVAEFGLKNLVAELRLRTFEFKIRLRNCGLRTSKKNCDSQLCQ